MFYKFPGFNAGVSFGFGNVVINRLSYSVCAHLIVYGF